MKSRKFPVVIASIVFLCVICNAEANWYNTNWQYRKKITISGSMTPNTDQTNFPLLIRRTSDSNLASHAQSDGDDILFTSSDGSTKLDHEIEKYVSSTGELWSWVRIPTLSTGTATVIYMYYGHPSIASQQNATGVWDSNYKAVWHFKETSGTTLNDSTSNANTGTATNGAVLNQAGQINVAVDFDGTNDYVSVADANSLDITSQLTISLWLRADTFPSSGAYDNVLIKGNSTAQNYYLETYNNSGTNRIAFGFTNPAGTFHELIGITTSLSTSTWYHVVASFVDNGTTNDIKLYINATQQNESTTAGSPEGNINLATNANALRIGFTITGEVFDGRIDEPRISNVVRSADWITTEYNNQNAPDTYITLRSEERAPADAVFFGTNF